MRERYMDSTGGLWHLEFRVKPIPSRGADWEANHDDFDGAPDSGDTRFCYAGTRENLIDAIEEIAHGS